MRSRFVVATVISAISALCLLHAGTAMSAAGADYFRDKTIKIIIPYGPGGTYDKYGQTFAEFLGRHIPGDPTVIVQHMSGAGGMKAMSWTYNVAPKDGLTMIVPVDNSVVTQLMQPKKVRFDARDFIWLGSTNQTNLVMAVRSDTGVQTWKDLRKEKIIASSSGQDTSFIFCRLVDGMLGGKIDIVSGYKGSSRAIFAIEQGETQMAAYNWLAWGSKVPHWFKGEKPFARIVMQMGIFKDPDIPQDVPMLSDLVNDPADKAVVAFIGSLGILGRGLALPPGVPDDVVETLRKAYDDMNADPDFAAELKSRHLRLIPSTGEKIQQVVADALDNATPAVVKHASQIIYGK